MSSKKLFLEMAGIILVAAVCGSIWNYKLLLGIWSGGRGAATFSSPAVASTGSIPLPAGLVQVKQLLAKKEAVAVDARDSLAFSQGHVKGAVSLPLGQYEAGIDSFTQRVPVTASLVVYCSGYGCHDGMNLGKKLLAKGYRQVFVYEGGYPEWKDAGLPTEGEAP